MEALVEGKLSFNQSTNTFLFYALLLFILQGGCLLRQE